MGEDLGERVPVDVELAAGGALAQAVDEDAATDVGSDETTTWDPS
jgi:hypothetical protein